MLLFLLVGIFLVEGKKDPKIDIKDVEVPEDCSIYAADGDTVSVHYTGKLKNGQVFDSSLDRGEPITVRLGTGQMIPGFEQAIRGACVGQKRIVTIPPELAYGDKGMPPQIPPHATLSFELQVVSIDRPSFVKDLFPFLQTISPLLLIISILVYLYKKINESSTAASSASKPLSKKDKKRK